MQLVFCFLFFVIYATIIHGCEFLHKRGLDAEYTRKIAHTASTLISLLIPIFFPSLPYVIMLGIILALLLYVTQHKHLFNSIHSVKRNTVGVWLLPISIGCTYYISRILQDNIFYILPIIILSISDSLACLSAKCKKSKIILSEKTIIGSAVFFISTFLICIFILFFKYTFITTVFAAFVISAITSFIELISTKGIDNLTIPLSVILSLMLVV